MSDTNRTNKTHQTAIILLADIQDFTRLSRGDPDQALKIRNRFRKTFEQSLSQFEGSLIHHREDKSLAFFESTVNATQCAFEIQKNVHEKDDVIPTSIALHMGEIIFENEDVFGSSISVVSHIESLGCDRSILMSTEVYEQLKENPLFEIQSMGYYLFKDITPPMEVYALANEGLVMPEKLVGPRATGKPMSSDELEKLNLEREGKKTMLMRLWKRGVPQLVAGYFVGATTILQFVDWFCKRNEISDHWTNLLLILFLSVIPSFVIYTYHRERIHLGKLNLFQKVFFPGNITITLLLLLIVFSNRDLSAKKMTASITNAEGQVEMREVYKDEFKHKVRFYRFTNKVPKDSSHNWLEHGIAMALWDDQSQFPYMGAGLQPFKKFLPDQIEQSKMLNYPFFLSGSYEVNQDQYKIETKLYQEHKKNVIITRLYEGENLFKLLDSISAQTRRDIGVHKVVMAQYYDIGVADQITDNVKAFKHFINGNYLLTENAWREFILALQKDPTMALAGRGLLTRAWASGVDYGSTASSLIRGLKEYASRLSPYMKNDFDWYYTSVLEQDYDHAIRISKNRYLLNPGDNNALYTYLYSLLCFNDTEALRDEVKLLDDIKIEVAVSPCLVSNLWIRIDEPIDGIALFNRYAQEFPEFNLYLLKRAILSIHSSELEQARDYLRSAMIKEDKYRDIGQALLKHIDFIESKNMQLTTNLNQYCGRYGYGVMLDTSLGYLISQRDDRSKPIEYLYQTGIDTFISPSWQYHQFRTYTFEKNDQDKVISLNIEYKSGNGQISDFKSLRKDSLVLVAIQQLLDRSPEARRTVDRAITEYPSFNFLKRFKQYLEYSETQSSEITHTNLRKCIREYENYALLTKDNSLWIRLMNYTEYPIFLTSDSTFIITTYDHIGYTFGIKNDTTFWYRAKLIDP